MDMMRGVVLRLRALFRREDVERELDDELRFHIDMEAEAQMRSGVPEAEARRAAQLKFGATERWREEARDARGMRPVDEMRQDVRLALRQLRATPSFAVAAIATLALGIGANTAIFSVVSAVLLEASPFEASDRLVMVWETDRSSETTHEPASWPDIADLRERSATLASVGAFAGRESTLLPEGGEPERVAGVLVTPNLFDLLGVHAVAGRLFEAGDGAAAAVPVAVLGEEYWLRRFGGDAGVVGTRVLIDEEPTLVIGVAPADADLGLSQIVAQADYASGFGGPDAEVYVALEPRAEDFPRQTHPFLTVGRLAPDVDRGAAQRELAAIMADLEAVYPENTARGVNVEALDDVIFGPVRPVLFVLLAAVVLVLLVTCANVATLLLARTTARTREVAVRRALGAAGARLGRQFLVENALLVVLGAAAGLLLAAIALETLVAMAPAEIPRLAGVAIDGRVLAFTFLLATLVTLAFAAVPLAQARRVDIQQALKLQGGRSATLDRGSRRMHATLVVAEVALAVTLVISAGLLIRSMMALNAVDPGFRIDGVLKAEYSLPPTRYPMDFSRWPDLPEINQLHASLLREVQAIPGVEGAALASSHPLDPGFTNSFLIVGREAESEEFPEIRTRFISTGYLETMDLALLAGRDFDRADVAGGPAVAVVNRAAAEAYFAGGDPIGHSIQFWGVPRLIVGVIDDERFHGPAEEPEPAVYAPLAQVPMSRVAVLLHARGNPQALIGPLRDRLRSLDPQLALFGVEPLEQTLSRSLGRTRFTTTLVGLFGALAFLLALIGVHGVLSYTVSRRAPEVAVRLALGASATQVTRLIVGEGLRLVVIGFAIGVALSLAGSRFLTSLLYGVPGTDVTTFVVVAAAILLTALLASWLPARRAARMQPATALRAD